MEKIYRSEEDFFSLDHFPKEARTLDVGCGNRKKIPWAEGIDQAKLPGVETVHNLNSYPWPFKENTFDFLIASHVIEHIQDIVSWCKEIHRICKPDAKIRIACPHFSSSNAFTDPTHIHFFGYRSFDYFALPEETPLPLAQKWINRLTSKGTLLAEWYSPPYFKIIERQITFHPPHRWLGISYFTRNLPYLYEHFLRGIFPARALLVTLKVTKPLPPES